MANINLTNNMGSVNQPAVSGKKNQATGKTVEGQSFSEVIKPNLGPIVSGRRTPPMPPTFSLFDGPRGDGKISLAEFLAGRQRGRGLFFDEYTDQQMTNVFNHYCKPFSGNSYILPDTFQDFILDYFQNNLQPDLNINSITDAIGINFSDRDFYAVRSAILRRSSGGEDTLASWLKRMYNPLLSRITAALEYVKTHREYQQFREELENFQALVNQAVSRVDDIYLRNGDITVAECKQSINDCRDLTSQFDHMGGPWRSLPRPEE